MSEQPYATTPAVGIDALTKLDLRLDIDLFDRIVADVDAHGAELGPAEPWEDTSLFGHGGNADWRPSFDDFIVPWIGFGQRPAAAEDTAAVRAFLDEVAPRARLPPNLRAALDCGEGLKVGDLWTAVDVGLITSHASPEDGPLTVLEIGGGYGRTAEALLRVPDLRVRCVLVDGVAGSLYYAHEYLKVCLPDRQVASWYVDGPNAAASADVFVVPSWHLGDVAGSFDAAVNISSFQEMRDDQIERYLELIDAAVRDGGIVYLSNSRVHKWTREYTYPATWRLEVKANNPAAFSLDRPVEVLRRVGADASAENRIVEEQYLASSYRQYRRTTDERIAELRGRLTAERDRAHQRAEERQVVVERLTAERDLARERAEDRQVVVERLTAERDRARERAEERQVVVERLTAARDVARERAEEREVALERLTAERDRARQRAEERQVALERLTAERDSARQRAEEREVALERLTAERDRARERAEERQGAVERLTAEREHLDELAVRLTAERDIARQRSEELEVAVQRLSAERERRNALIVRLTAERDVARQRAEEHEVARSC